jgi:hypothetical protein
MNSASRVSSDFLSKVTLRKEAELRKQKILTPLKELYESHGAIRID